MSIPLTTAESLDICIHSATSIAALDKVETKVIEGLMQDKLSPAEYEGLINSINTERVCIETKAKKEQFKDVYSWENDYDDLVWNTRETKWEITTKGGYTSKRDMVTCEELYLTLDWELIALDEYGDIMVYAI